VTGDPPTPAHVEDTVQAIARLHQAHRDRATRAERLVGRATGVIARPGVMAAALGVVVGWVGFNLVARLLGWRAFDPAPFQLLQGVLTLLALGATVLVLNTQRREDDIATQREQLSLQLAMLSDHKLAKVIALLEELRRDHPEVRDRVDVVADEMARPADPQRVLDALRED
jgi:uncharacterized membrane protein